MRSLRCWLFGHDWRHLPEAIPEDRKTFRCKRCDDWGYNPGRVGENHVSDEEVGLDA